ncbi:MAG: hypothetical protein AAGD38_20425 [Acidobacteriota bacterium]
MNASTAADEEARWFGDYSVGDRQITFWAIGPLRLWLEHRPLEWWIGWQTGREVDDQSLIVAREIALDDMPETVERRRFAVQGATDRIRLAPRLADRPVVSRPRIPVQVLAGEQVTVFVSTPLWLELRALPVDRRLLEVPVVRAHDTWFGPNTRSGGVAYASFTRARVDLESMPRLLSLALTQVTVENHGRDDLLIERLSIPAPELSLFIDRDNRFWTQSLTVRRDTTGNLAAVRLANGPPATLAPESELIAAPRHNPGRGVLRRALDALLG